jgi:hypothetical protein
VETKLGKSLDDLINAAKKAPSAKGKSAGKVRRSRQQQGSV